MKKLNCVLLVDDNDSDNFLHQLVIEQSGIAAKIEVASNGKEAIEFLKENWQNGSQENSSSQPDIIFLDINMPVMDGWEFLEAYQRLEDEQKGNIIIVMLTTSLNPADKIKADKISIINGYYYKPLTIEMVKEIMQNNFPDYL
jgi:CheY-like chemotaxis protein